MTFWDRARARQWLAFSCLALGWLVADPGSSAAESAIPEPIGRIATHGDVDAGAPRQASFGNLPLHFEVDRDHVARPAQFVGRARGYGVRVNPGSAELALGRPRHPLAKTEPEAIGPAERTIVRMTLVGADLEAAGAGLEQLPGRVNYFIGRDPDRWRTDVPTYRKVWYHAIYPGIDLVYYGNERQLEYDFVIGAGSDPGAIDLSFEGADTIEMEADGDVVLRAGGGELRLRRPSIYQDVNGVRQAVAGGYVQTGDRRVGFRVPAYDTTRALTIDPVLIYSTYLGGVGEDNVSGVAVDATGIYLAGLTVSPNFPTAGSPYQGAQVGDYDAFVTKLDPTGTTLIYSTYLGGAGTDYGLGLTVDASGNAHVTGLTTSTDFPTTAGAYQAANGGGIDGFVTKLNRTGSGLLYSTYLGGDSTDYGIGVTLDGSGNVYVVGRTDSTDFPLAGTPLQSALGGDQDGFVAKLNPAASGTASLVYSTYLGGSGQDRVHGIVVDALGNATVTGRTSSTDFPTAGTPFQAASGGGFDAFVATLDPTGSNLRYSTYLGGSGDDRSFSIARDSSGKVYITGHTTSTNFPTTAGAFDTACGVDGACDGGFMDVFVAKLDTAAAGAASLVYSTYLGGSRDDEAESIAVDTSGNAFVTGYTDSTDFPVANAFQPICGMGCGTGFVDAFVTKLDPTGTPVFSTYLGGSSSDYGIAIAIDSSGNSFVAGESFSDNFPTVNAVYSTWSGNYDGFVAKIDNAGAQADLALGETASPDPATAGAPLTYTLTVTNNGPDPATGVRLIGRLPAASVTVSSFTPSQGACLVASDAFFHEVRCDLGSLASAAAATVIVGVTPTFAGAITSTVSVGSQVSDPVAGNNAVARDTTVNLPPPPTITGFTPGSGAVGASVAIAGTNLGTASAVAFSGTDAVFTVDSNAQITAAVPPGATTGAIAVTTLSGTATSASAFSVGVPPSITSISPASGAPGTAVTINGTNLAGATSVAFNGTTAAFTINTSTRTTATVPAAATTGPITVTTPFGSAASATAFAVAPRITGFTPAGGAVGASVVISGANFTGATAVRFNGILATFHVDSSAQITATVPANATTGPISVVAPAGTGSSTTAFTVAPRITSFTPSAATTGTSVAINGANFTGATSVAFNGALANFTVVSAVKITTAVPAGASSGRIAVATSAGTATSAADFTVTQAPAITGVSPTSGAAGASVVITGSNFTGVSSVKFNGIAAAFTVISPSRITTTVPANATTGAIAVTTPGGTATSAPFTVAPRITNFSPTGAVIGASVAIAGANFTGGTSVTFNGTPAAVSAVTPTRITATVPAGATTGKIGVTTPAGSAASGASFTVKPAIASLAPSAGAVGTSVTITGTALGGATAVRFNGTAASFHVDTSTQITATVPANASTGPLTVTTPRGTATSATAFTVAPRIIGFTPTHGGPGTSVVINGANFIGATSVRFNGTSARYAVTSAIKITATVPAGASAGTISVTTPAGTATSAGAFAVP